MKDMISVIIPTYNRYEMLKQAIDSVIMQSYKNVEIIVVDDCSKDNTYKIKDEYPNIRYIKNKNNMGPGFNRKLAFEISNGEYIIFLDDDDFYTDRDFFSKAVCILSRNLDLVFVAANSIVWSVMENKYRESKIKHKGCLDALEYLIHIDKYIKPQSTFLTVFRKNSLNNAEFESMNMVNDLPIYLRVLSFGGKVYILEDIVGVYRLHENNISNNLTVQFIIDNMEEKLFVYNKLKKTNLRLYDEWWNMQIETTVGYWVYLSNPALNSLYKMNLWCYKNTEDKKFVNKIFRKYKSYIIDVRVCALKRRIKKILNIQ